MPKLSNFANDIEAFVALSCPYGIILDVSDFYRPVLSPFEAEAALNPQCRWSAGDGWTAEFKNFLHGNNFVILELRVYKIMLGGYISFMFLVIQFELVKLSVYFYCET